jgi:hypothetical protein
MAFPTARFYVGRNSRYSAEDIRLAQEYLPDLFRRYGQDSWLRQPVGHIGKLWLADTQASAVELVPLAKALNSAERCIHDSSRPFFQQKIKVLLRGSPDEKQYLENLTELQVMAAFGPKSVHLEPATPRDHPAGSKPLPGPDFGLEIAGFPFDVEVTVLRAIETDKWAAATDQLKHRVLERLRKKRGLFRQVGFATRWVFQDQNVPRKVVEEIVRRIEATPTGNVDLNEFGIAGSVEWYPEAPPLWRDLSPPVPPGAIGLIGTTKWMIFADGDQDQLLDLLEESIRRVFQKKRGRKQVREGTPCLVMLRLGSPFMSADGIADAIGRRVWNNEIHASVSAAAIYQQSEDPRGGSSVSVTRNPRARYPIPTDVFRVLTALAEARKRAPHDVEKVSLSLSMLVDPRVDLRTFLSEFLSTPLEPKGPDVAPPGAYSPGHDVQIHYLGRRREGTHPTMLLDFAIETSKDGFGILAVHLIEKVLRKKRRSTSPFERPEPEARLWVNRREVKSDDDVFAILREALAGRTDSKADVPSEGASEVDHKPHEPD